MQYGGLPVIAGAFSAVIRLRRMHSRHQLHNERSRDQKGKMNIRTTIGAMVLAATAGFASQASAVTCTETFSLTTMGPPGFRPIGNDFDRAMPQFNDCYNFTLSDRADAFGLTLEWDQSNTSSIDLTSVSLTGGSLVAPAIDPAQGWFGFEDLLAGTYQLIVSGSVSGSSYGSHSVGYAGFLATYRDNTPSRVPEPGSLALMALGLAVAGWTAKRGARRVGSKKA